MACNTCSPCSPTDQSCITSPVVLAPCACPETPATREEGPPGAEGAVGETPVFTVGSVTEGTANVIFTTNTPTDITVDFVVPQPPINTANTWTAAQTYEQQAVFEQGLETTGGTSTFGGTAFDVTPDADFGGDLDVAGAATIAGTMHVEQDTTIAGNMSNGAAAFLANTTINGEVTFDSSTAIVVSDSASGRFPRGILVLDSCFNPQLLPNRGGDLYQKEDATGLVTIATLDDGSICDAFVVNVPVSSCLPQVTPVVDIQVRIAYNFSAQPNGAIIVRLWKTAITSGTQLDEFTQGENTFDNTLGGCIILNGQTTLQVGNTSFFVEVVNNCDQDFVPNQVTFWATNN